MPCLTQHDPGPGKASRPVPSPVTLAAKERWGSEGRDRGVDQAFGQGRAEGCEGIEQQLWHEEQSRLIRAEQHDDDADHSILPIFIVTAMNAVSLSILLAAVDAFRDCNSACAAAAFALPLT
ncbi:unnamed protein product [Calypogeia fissa]